MNLLPDTIDRYAEAHSNIIDEKTAQVLRDLERMTHLKVLMPQMLSGNLQGQWLAFFSRLVQPKTILEIGTFTGYSAICLAQGLAEGGLLHTIDINQELEAMIRDFHGRAGISERVRLHIGDANRIINTIEGDFDLVFIDADKMNYYNYYNMIIDRVRKGGYIVVDNVLWSGKVTEKERDKTTEIIHQFNESIQADQRVRCLLLPIRDGLMLIQKI